MGLRISQKAYAWGAVVFAAAMMTLAWLGGAFAADGVGDVVGTNDTGLNQWELIVAFVVPAIVAFFVRTDWPQWVETLIMLAVSLVVCIVTMLLKNIVEPEDLLSMKTLNSWLTVIALTIAYYKGVWKPSGAAPAIEANIGLKQ